MNKMKPYLKKKKIRNILTLCAVILSALLQTYTIQAFMHPANLLSSGFTGVALLLNTLTDGIINTSLAILCLNVPIALFCIKHISPRFTLFSCIQFASTSLFLTIFDFQPLFNDVILSVAVGGFLYGLSVVFALQSGASTGGTDFIALYFSNKYGKALWNYVFIFNCGILLIFGSTKGWQGAAYSIIFQLISTKTIENFHPRYQRLTMQITTSHPQEILTSYTQNYHHGISCLEGYGGFSKLPFTVCTTVVSSYEVQEIIDLLKAVDPKIIINIYKTENFVGGFYQRPIE